VRNKDVLLRVKVEKNILCTIKRRKANWIGHIFHILHMNCVLKHVSGGMTEGRVEVTGRQGRRCKQLLNDLKETRGYWKLKKEALGHTVWRTHFGKGCGCVIRQTVE